MRDLCDMSSRQEALALFGFPGLTDLAKVLPAYHDEQGYPDLMLFATLSCARIWRSQNAALITIREDGLWPELVREYSRVTSNPGPFPLIPPSAQHLDKFLARIGKDESLLLNLRTRFTQSAIQFARVLGHFDPTIKPDWTNVDRRHLIIGDGSYVPPFSKVTETWDEEHQRMVVFGSKAKRKARIQRVQTDSSADDKQASGINHVTICTPTEYGWIALATEHALRAEIRTATPMIERIVELADGGIHTVVWDGAYSGVSKEVIMARLGLLTVTKPVKRSNRQQRKTVGSPMEATKAIAMFRRGEHLPLGTSVFPTGDGHEMIPTLAHRYGALPAIPCSHDLWVDGDAFVDVAQQPNGKLLKIADVSAIRAVRYQRASGDYGAEIEWRVPCADGDHTFTTRSEPRRDEAQASRRASAGHAVANASPISRTNTEIFRAGFGFRNWTESFNSWFKSRLGNSAGEARAMRLQQEHQAADHISAALVANSNCYWRFQKANR